jgi:hypothetical protein
MITSVGINPPMTQTIFSINSFDIDITDSMHKTCRNLILNTQKYAEKSAADTNGLEKL